MKSLVVASATALLLVSGFAHADDAKLARGKELFTGKAVPACAMCHTLKDAGATGAIGPNLDQLKPDAERVEKILKEGRGAMPSFAATLSEEDREAVAAYVSTVAGK